MSTSRGRTGYRVEGNVPQIFIMYACCSGPYTKSVVSMYMTDAHAIMSYR